VAVALPAHGGVITMMVVEDQAAKLSLHSDFLQVSTLRDVPVVAVDIVSKSDTSVHVALHGVAGTLVDVDSRIVPVTGIVLVGNQATDSISCWSHSKFSSLSSPFSTLNLSLPFVSSESSHFTISSLSTIIFPLKCFRATPSESCPPSASGPGRCHIVTLKASICGACATLFNPSPFQTNQTYPGIPLFPYRPEVARAGCHDPFGMQPYCYDLTSSRGWNTASDWSPHNDAIVASGHVDGKAMIWNIVDVGSVFSEGWVMRARAELDSSSLHRLFDSVFCIRVYISPRTTRLAFAPTDSGMIRKLILDWVLFHVSIFPFKLHSSPCLVFGFLLSFILILRIRFSLALLNHPPHLSSYNYNIHIQNLHLPTHFILFFISFSFVFALDTWIRS
jgi:hypothetical protein